MSLPFPHSVKMVILPASSNYSSQELYAARLLPQGLTGTGVLNPNILEILRIHKLYDDDDDDNMKYNVILYFHVNQTLINLLYY